MKSDDRLEIRLPGKLKRKLARQAKTVDMTVTDAVLEAIALWLSTGADNGNKAAQSARV